MSTCTNHTIQTKGDAFISANCLFPNPLVAHLFLIFFYTCKMYYILQQQNNVYITIQIQPMQIGHKQEWVLKKNQSFLKSLSNSQIYGRFSLSQFDVQ